MVIREYTVKQGKELKVRDGVVAALQETSGVNKGKVFQGGEHQFEFVDNIRGDNWKDFLTISSKKGITLKLANGVDDLFNSFSKAIDFGGDIIKRTNKKLNILWRVNPKNGTIGTSKLRTELIAKGVPEAELTALLTPMPSSWNNMSVIGMNTKYWNDINKLHIDDIIANGGDIRFIQDPRLAVNQFNRVSDMLNGPFKTKCINEGLVKIKTFMKMEYDYLLSKGYVLQADGLMIKP